MSAACAVIVVRTVAARAAMPTRMKRVIVILPSELSELGCRAVLAPDVEREVTCTTGAASRQLRSTLLRECRTFWRWLLYLHARRLDRPQKRINTCRVVSNQMHDRNATAIPEATPRAQRQVDPRRGVAKLLLMPRVARPREAPNWADDSR